MMKYPRKLSSGANNTVIVLNDKEVAKLFTGDTRSDLGSEAQKMRYANDINNLLAKFIRLDFNIDLDVEMLVMERIYPIDFRAYEIEIRELWLDVFIDELHQLHKNGFVHRDLKRPSNIGGLAFDNILLTNEGLRLIDVGISVIKEQVGDKIFEKYLEIENIEIIEFKEYFLNR
jgi:serine/threonine protein kinase